MSERGWREFVAADGLDDWVVLHGGATAVFRAGSLAEAVRLAGAVAEVAGFESSGALLTLADVAHARGRRPRIASAEELETALLHVPFPRVTYELVDPPR